MRRDVMIICILILVIACLVVPLPIEMENKRKERRDGEFSFVNAPMIVKATTTSGATWTLDLSKVVIIAKYSSGKTFTVDQLYNTLVGWAGASNTYKMKEGVVCYKWLTIQKVYNSYKTCSFTIFPNF